MYHCVEHCEDDNFAYAGEQFADIQMLRYKVNGLEALTQRQHTLIWHLAEAALWGRDILWHQNCRYNLPIRRLFEHIFRSYKGDRTSAGFKAFELYLKRMWFSNGIHHHYACDKFQPDFSREYLLELMRQTDVEGAHSDIFADTLHTNDLPQTLDELLEAVFNPQLHAKRVNQAEGEDLLLSSACNYYDDTITQSEAEAFYEQAKSKYLDSIEQSQDDGYSKGPVMLGMNSKLVRANDGSLQEKMWVEDGMYGPAIKKIVAHLQAACDFAENEQQRDVISKLVEFYRTGNLRTFDIYTILWVAETQSRVDFTNGFTEVYGDPLGLKASWEGYVNFTDPVATERTERISREAQWFEDHSPVDARFKKKKCCGVSAKVINAALLGGDLYPASAIGINLPNNDWVRSTYGSKSVTIGNLTHAYDMAAQSSGFREEFIDDAETLQWIKKYGDKCDDLHTDLHECLGHGSGQMLPGVDLDALKAYGSTIEEARADLFALYYLADKKLVELELLPDEEAYKANYYSYLLNGLLTQLVRIEPGRNIEEAHMRNRSLIAHWVLDNYPHALQLVTNADGKTFLRIHSYSLLRDAFGALLAEIQRVKSEGDFDAARELVERYGVTVDAKLHEEVLARYKKLHLSPYKGFINPRYETVSDDKGHILSITPHYDESFTEQQLRYSKDYSC